MSGAGSGPGPPGSDVLDQGRERPAGRRLPGRWGWVALVLVAVTLAGLWWADVDRRRREYAALTARFTAAQDDLTYARRRVASVVEYASPHIATAPEDVRAGLRALVQDAAAGQLPALRDARASVEAVTVWPWHRALVQARATCVAALDGWTAYVAAVSRDARALGGSHAQLDVELDDALAALRAARPNGLP